MKAFAFIVTISRLCLQVGTLSVIHFIGFIVAAQLSGVLSQTANPVQSAVSASTEIEIGDSPSDSNGMETTNPRVNADTAKQLLMLGNIVLVCLLNSAVMASLILRSKVYGLKMVGFTFFVFLMCMTVMPQSETYFFVRNSSGIIRMASTMGLVVSGLFSVSASLS